jgi:hypothetical protein
MLQVQWVCGRLKDPDFRKPLISNGVVDKPAIVYPVGRHELYYPSQKLIVALPWKKKTLILYS